MKKGLLIAIFILTFFVMGCGTEDYIAIVGNIDGVVINSETKEPISGCEVINTSIGSTKITDTNGRFSFNEVTPGNVTLVYKASGYETASKEYIVTSGKTISANISLTPIYENNSLTVSSSVLDFGTRDVVCNLFLRNTTTKSIQYDIESSASWIKTDPTRGTVIAGGESLVKVTVDRNEISDGTYEKVLLIKTSTSTIEIQVLVDKGLEMRPVVTTVSVTQNSDKPSNIDAVGAITTVGSSSILRHGFCYAIGKDPTLEDCMAATNLGNINSPEQFSGILPNMEYEKEYYIRSYATNEVGTGYGEVLKIILHKQESAKIVTKDASDITSTSAVLNGGIERGSVNLFNFVGFYYGETPDCKNKSENATLNNGMSFNIRVDNLSPNKEYYYKAYGTDDTGTYWGNVESFRTRENTENEGTISMITSQASNIGDRTATLNGTLVINGTARIKDYGFYYGKTSNPTLREVVKSYSSPTVLQSTSFSATIPTLDSNTQYYFQSYAIDENSNIIKGSIQSFTTKSTPTITINFLKMESESGGQSHNFVMSGEATVQHQGYDILEAGFVYKRDNYSLTYNTGTVIQSEIENGKISFSQSLTDYTKSGVYIRAYMILSDGSIVYNGDKIYFNIDMPFPR